METELKKYNLSRSKCLKDRAEIIGYVSNYAYQEGFSISIRRSSNNKKTGKLKEIEIICSRGEKYRGKNKSGSVNGNYKGKKAGTKKTDCQFEVKFRGKEMGFCIAYMYLEHNHPMADEQGRIILNSKINDDEFKLIERMTNAGVSPIPISISINSNSKNPKAMMAVYNARKKVRSNMLGGRTPIQSLFDTFYNTNDYVSAYKNDDDGSLSHFLLCHKESLKMFYRYSSVITIDSTYKTNRYRMPLCAVIGMTAHNSSFTVCYIFMKSESIMDYLWAISKMDELIFKEFKPKIILSDRDASLLHAIRTQLPNTISLLCLWHIEKNVLTQVSKEFLTQEGKDNYMKEFNNVVSSDNMDDYIKSKVGFIIY